MRWAASVLVAALLLISAAAATADDDNGLSEDLPRVKSLKIEGNHAVGDGKIRNIVTLESPSFLRPFRVTRFRREFLDADVRAVTLHYRSLGYLDVAVTGEVRFDDDYQNAYVTMRIEEGERTIVRAIRFRGNATVPDKKLLDEIDSEVGDPYNEFQVREDREALRAYLQDLGHLTAAVADSSAFDSLSATVTFDVREGREMFLRVVSVDGNEHTKGGFVSRELVVRPGDLVRRKDLLESQRKLFETGLFSDAQISPVVADSSEGQVDLAVHVRERKTSWVALGVGYSSRDLARLSGEWGNRNVGGDGRRLTVQSQIGLSLDTLFVKKRFPPLGETLNEISWREPWFLGTRTPLVFSGYHRFQRQQTFNQTIFGLKSTARRDLSATEHLFLTVENRWVTTTDSTLQRERYTSRLIDLRGERDTRDNIFDPARGALQQGLAEYAGGFLGGQSTFQKYSASAAWYKGVGKGLVLGWRAQMGLIEPVSSQLGGTAGDSLEVLKVPFEDRFFAGGANTVRGYPEQLLGRTKQIESKTQPLGGLALFVANVELRVPLFWLFSGALFVDAGNVWADREEFKLSRFVGDLNGGTPSILDMKYGGGVGLRIRTPVGPVRIDYGRKIGASRVGAARDYEFHFSVGQAF